jgi:Na+/glutamate symporter
MLRGHFPSGLTAIFLATTLITSLTGFLFPISAFTPALVTGVLSTVVLAFALLALYVFRLANAWRPIYVVTAVAALYLNVFVAIVQAFQKLGPLQALAPTQWEPPFLVAQGVVLALFVIAGFIAAKAFRPALS